MQGDGDSGRRRGDPGKGPDQCIVAHENITGCSGEGPDCFSFYPDYTAEERSLPRQEDFVGI